MTTATPTFETATSYSAPSLILPQKAGSRLWAPMFVMAVMGFVAGIVLAGFRADAVSNGDAQSAAALANLGTAAMFLGFASVFAAISFAIARILGEFRVGGGAVQALAGGEVKTLKMPATARAFLGLMMMAMMTLLVAVVLQAILGFQIADGDAGALANAEQFGIYLEAARRFATTLYLFAIALGLATIVTVLRYQSIRIREVASPSATN